MRIANEFAAVQIDLDERGNGPRLRIEDLSTGVHIYLDPLELQSLAWATHRDMTTFARPFFKERAFDRKMGRALSDAALEEAEHILRDQDEEDE